MAGLWCVNVGYGRRELAQAAYDQLMTLSYYNAFFKTAAPSAIELAKDLVDITPEGLNHVFFTNSGSEANDTIARMVRHYWNLAGKPDKQILLSREFAYHGTTLASASLSGPRQMPGGQGGIPLPGFDHVMPPYRFLHGRDGESADAFADRAAQALDDRIRELGPANVAAFFGEPIQGAGGVIMPPETYWPKVADVCRKHDVLLVADEVITGFGRTGDMFASQGYGIQPDLMTLAKGVTSGYVPLGAAMVGDRVARRLIDDGGEFFHGFTYSGHPTACAVGRANLQLMRDERLVERVRDDIGPYFAQALERLSDHPLVGEVRTRGLLGAVEICRDPASRARFQPEGTAGRTCRDACLTHGAVVRAVRDTMVLSPAYVVTRDQVDQIVAILRRALDDTASALI
jgi:putrescine aminotransferase